MTEDKLREKLVELKAFVDFDSKKPYVGIYFNDLYEIICKDKLLYESLLEKAAGWFKDIEEMCSKLTSGNVAHLGATIRGKAIRAAEFIEKHKES